MDKINAIILAGDDKSFLTIQGKWMVEYVVEALRRSPCVDKISIVGQVERLTEKFGERVDYYAQCKGDIFDNLEAALEPFDKGKVVLIVTSDIPMIRGEIVTDFIIKCHDSKADLCYPIVEKRVNDGKYPGFHRTYVRVREGIYTGGNIIYVNASIIKDCAEFARRIIAYRKKPWKISRLLGFRFLVMLIIGILSISRVEERISQVLNINVTAIVSEFPELVNDVDKDSDLEMVYKHFVGKNTGKIV